MASKAPAVRIDDLRAYHNIDREVYSRLVIDLNLDLIQAMEMISMWLWMEEVGYANLILKMVGLPNDALKALAEEAIACLRVVACNAPPPPQSDSITLLPLTNYLLEGQFIDLNYFYKNRETATYKIHRNVDGICKSVFDDIVQQVLSFSPNQQASSEPNNMMVMPNPDANLVGPGPGPNPAAFAPSFHPIVFGTGFTPILRPTHATATGVYHGAGGVTTFEMGESSSAKLMLNPSAEPYEPTTASNSELAAREEVIHPDDRTLFVTFSRGYPIPKSDVLNFFVRKWGDCVERIIMQEVLEYQQPLYARVVLYSASKMYDILQGKERKKFIINGRHILVRRYEAREE